jgi:hypothetical protein
MSPQEARNQVTDFSTGLMLLPAGIVAFDGPAQPVERLMWLQSAVAPGIQLATGTGPLFAGLFRRLVADSRPAVSKYH